MNAATRGLLLILLSCGAAAAFCALIRLLAPKVGLVDRPGGRKAHRRPTPLGGGIGIWLTVALTLGAAAAAGRLDAAQARPLALLMALATAVMLMGLIDDRRPLGWKPRLAIQFALAFAVAGWLGRITLFPPLSNPVIGGLVTAFWIVGLTNAFNFLDNMDGLAASVGLIAAALFAAAQVGGREPFVPLVLLALVGALAGFLVHNAPPARLFMGDAGSNFIGFLLGSLTVLGTYTRPYAEGESPAGVLAPLLVMAVPLYDSISVMLIRYREGRSLFQADRRHFSHRLVERGLTPARAVATIDLVTLAGGLGALLLHRLEWPGAAVVVGQTLCLLGVVALLEYSTNGRPAQPGPPRGSDDGEPSQGQGDPPRAAEVAGPGPA